MEISEITRRNMIDYLIMQERPFYGRMDPISFLKRIWVLSSMPSTDFRHTDAEGDINQHMVWNCDWSHDYLLNNYKAFRVFPALHYMRKRVQLSSSNFRTAGMAVALTPVERFSKGQSVAIYCS